MTEPPVDVEGFRHQIQQAREQFPYLWEVSRKYMAAESYQDILPQLIEDIRQAAGELNWGQQSIAALLNFRSQQSPETQQQHHQILKALTGLPPSKAVRALIVWGLSQESSRQRIDSAQLSVSNLQALLQRSTNPYDLLFQVPVPSLLDIGAGDLTFEQELVEYYRGQSIPHKARLILHAFDRLHPGSKVGGVYHRNRDREQFLKNRPSEELQFRFWGDMGLDAFPREKYVLPRYTMVTCHAPANPTFAYEPSRLDSRLIQESLQSTRGVYRKSRFEGEPVLEVEHRGQMLTFPPWKFEILGPLRLLRFMGRMAAVGVLSAVDDEVFWETLSQLLADDRYRPPNQILTTELRREIFGELFDHLQRLNPGEGLDLSKIANLRTDLFKNAEDKPKSEEPGRLAYVEIRRGAVWPGVPSSFTARQFKQMKEEDLPWWIIFALESWSGKEV